LTALFAALCHRLVAQEEAHALSPGTLMTRDGFFQFSEKALVSIIIGASASTDVIREIREIAGSDAITVKKATRVPHRYELAITA
jgi:hypothetical protein